ncbi:hypothetical protein RDWZM_009114 [Blomia tropicalis]|uniref:WD repeat and HMG-box DNA-binding protein 1 n=1 Tax=Blomia tropicalis TaxID=40697 RepID=A0A9Q0M306_BLOTA|nr:hypothetical protein RDWZM_009114 [Blomia tropicalis]
MLITVGAECEFCIWELGKDIKEYYNRGSFSIEQTIFHMISYVDNNNENRILVATEECDIKSLPIGQFEQDQVVTICQLDSLPTHMDLNFVSKLLAVGTSSSILLVNIEDKTENQFVDDIHGNDILTVALDPLNEYIASSSCNGQICIWSIESKSIIHRWEEVKVKVNSYLEAENFCRMAWQPIKGDILAVPKSDSVHLYKRKMWNKPWKQLKHNNFSDVSIVVFSSQAEFIAAASTQVIIMIWKWSNIERDILIPSAIVNQKAIISSLKFNPADPLKFSCTDMTGLLRNFRITSEKGTPILTNSLETYESNKEQQKTEPEKKIRKSINFDDVLSDIDDDDFDCIQINESDPIVRNSKKSSHNHQLTKPSLIENLDDDSLQVSNHTKETFEEDLDENQELEVEFDIGQIKSRYEPHIFSENDNFTSVKPENASNVEVVINGERIKVQELISTFHRQSQLQEKATTRQESFQSGSTPIHYQQRFMMWNNVGIIYGHNTDEERSIDVEFHDSSFHHSIHLTNMFNYTMADLSNTCFVLASNGDDEAEDELDHLKARLFSSIHTYMDHWRNSDIDHVVNRSSRHYHSSRSTFDDAVPSRSHVADQGQSIGCQVLKVDHHGKSRNHPIPTPISVALSPKSTVYWAGFTDEGTPCICDSDGIVRVYKTHFGNGWFPICATKQQAKGKSDNYFIIGVSEIQSQIRCIYCKVSRYPNTVPKPIMQILSLQIPLCEMYTNKSLYEEEYIRNRVLTTLLKKLSLEDYEVDQVLKGSENSMINSLVKLFALSLGAKRESVALEIAYLMPNRIAMEAAIKYAEQKKHRPLALKLVEMISDLENENDDDGHNSDTELAQLLIQKNRDQMVQFIPESGESSNNSRLVPLGKINGSNSDLNILKPKSIKKNNIAEPNESNKKKRIRTD